MLPKLAAEFQHRVHLGDGFTCDSYVFRRSVHQGEYQEMRMLHVGRILPAAWPQMLDVLKYIGDEGFVCHKRSVGNRHVEPPFCPDIALIGCFSRDMEDIEDIISELERNHGMFRKLDMLVYFIDDKVPRKAFGVMGRSGVISRYEFANDAGRLIHMHLQRRYDVVARRGAYTTMDRMLTESLDRVAKPKDGETLGAKVRRAGNILKKYLPDNDVDTVIKCLKLLLWVRNWNAHPGSYAFRKRKEAYDSVRPELVRRQYSMARDHDPNRPKPKTADAQDLHDTVKNFLVLTYRIKDWLDAYAKAVGRP